MGAGAAALLAHWAWAALVLLVALGLLRITASGDTRRFMLGTVVLFAATTLLFTPVWLHLFVAVGLVDAVWIGAVRALRLSAVLATGLTLAVVLPPLAWLTGLRRFPRLALALTLTFRQVPDLAEETQRIRRAQRARGLASGPLLTRPLAVAAPLIARALHRAERMGDALVLAGWTDGAPPPDPVVRPRPRRGDLLAYVLGGLLLTVALLSAFNIG